MLPYQRLSCFSFDLANVRMALRAEGKAAEAETLYTEAVEADGMSVVCHVQHVLLYVVVTRICSSSISSICITGSSSSICNRGGSSGSLSVCASRVCNTFRSTVIFCNLLQPGHEARFWPRCSTKGGLLGGSSHLA